MWSPKALSQDLQDLADAGILSQAELKDTSWIPVCKTNDETCLGDIETELEFIYGGLLPTKSVTDWWVDDEGSDSLSCGTELSPCATIGYVEAQLTGGETIHIMPGSYSSSGFQTFNLQPNRIRATKDGVTYQGESDQYGNLPVIDASSYVFVWIDPTGTPHWGENWFGWAAIIDASDVTIKNLVFQDMNHSKGISVTGTESGVVLENIHLDGVCGSGIYVKSHDNLEIFDSTITDACFCEQTIGEIENECLTIEDTSNFDVYGNTVTECGKEAIDVKNGSSSGEVHHNTIIGEDYSRIGIYIDGYDQGVEQVQVYSNTISGFTTGSGIRIAHEQCGEVSDIYLYNNILYNNSRGIHFKEGTTTTCDPSSIHDIYVYFNTVADSVLYNSYSYALDIDAVTLDDAVIANNIFANTATGGKDIVASYCEPDPNGDDDYAVRLINNLYGTIQLNLTCAAENDTTLEGLSAGLNSTYHLLFNSPAKSVADTNYTYSLIEDIDDQSRPLGFGMDVGADEYPF